MINESTQSGFNGRGYVAGWNTNGTSIDFYVNQNTAGTKTITFRYAAGAGTASRYVKVNGVNAVSNLSFSGTTGWSSWNTISLTVSLQAGSNTIQLGYDSSKGNNNWLNVDQMYGL